MKLNLHIVPNTNWLACSLNQGDYSISFRGTRKQEDIILGLNKSS